MAPRDEPKIIVAVLLYTDQISQLYRLYKTLLSDEGIDALDGKEDIAEDVKERIRHAKAMFKPERISLDHPARNFPSGTRLPFLREDSPKSGSFGTVSKVEVHPEYIGDDVKELIKEYAGEPLAQPSADQKFFIARKMIQGIRGQTLENSVQMERDFLDVIRQQKEGKENLIDLIAFYTFGDEINMLFPYVALNLHDLLYHGQLPRNYDTHKQFPDDWISSGIRGMAQGLCTIHHPQIAVGNDREIVGFHFDLKPRNVLITWDGTFKITDFGQALIKVVRIGIEQHGEDGYRGGDPEYAPPESMPTRHLVESRYVSHTSPTTNGRPGSRDLFKYDIWSLACIMVQLYTYLCLGKVESVVRFDEDRRMRAPGSEVAPYHIDGMDGPELNPAVATQLDKISAYSLSVESPALHTYMEGLVTTMSQMLEINPSDRPTSGEVAERLTVLVNDYQAARNDPSGVLLAANNDDLRDIPKSYVEVAMDTNGTSFVALEGVRIASPDSPQNAGLPCRLRLFHQKGGFWMKIWFKRASKLEIVSKRLPEEEVRLIHSALLDGGDRGHCRILRLGADGFETDLYFENGLVDFHAAIVQYIPQSFGIVGGEPQDEMRQCYSLRHPVTVSARREFPRDLAKIRDGIEATSVQNWISVQKWKARRLTYVDGRHGPQRDIGLRLMIFFHNPAAVLQIPLRSRLGKVEVERRGATTAMTFRGLSREKFFTYVEKLESGMDRHLWLPIGPAHYPVGNAYRQGDNNTWEVRLETKYEEGGIPPV
ncbi:serine/threonine protein kinase [Cladophialophora psammophila CBS 110553]|uniref:non-specific serine/threonine protein kinase n=1 Tax=Cladophialophora psammophila CBS 110553 TaxID=1182543 RepID=W9X2R1_9EURO|nr:serine/threonine protein kinase [Cladophialophora psammophila CBS 110553]EXJ71600.1 serine/threonine protein kinase [Cladophialophora psammophila CBS 110553]